MAPAAGGGKRRRNQVPDTSSSEQSQRQQLRLQIAPGLEPGTEPEPGPQRKKCKLIRIEAPVKGTLRIEVPAAPNGGAPIVVSSPGSSPGPDPSSQGANRLEDNQGSNQAGQTQGEAGRSKVGLGKLGPAAIQAREAAWKTPKKATRRPSISIGVEIEFLAEFPRLIKNDNYENDALLRDHVVFSRLVQQGLAEFGHPPRADEYAQWQVKHDSSVSPDTMRAAKDGHRYTDVELVSRVLPDLRTAEAEIRRAFRGLRALDGTFHVNETTGLHVHLGFGGAEIPFATAKTLVLLVTAFEHRIHQLLPRHRLWRQGGVNRQCVPPSHLRPLLDRSAKPTGRQTIPFYERLQRINKCSTLAELGAIFNAEMPLDQGPDRFVAYNFLPLVDLDDARNTVEFRHFPSASNPDFIVPYVRFAYHLLAYCRSASEAQASRLIRNCNKRHFTVVDFLREIKPSLVKDFEDMLFDHNLEAYPMPWEPARRT